MAKRRNKGATDARNAAGIGLLALTAVLIVLLAMFVPEDTKGSAGTVPTGESPLRLSEVMSSNASTLMTADGAAPDWIEIENTAAEAASLNGFALMVDNDPAKMVRFSGLTVEAGGHIVLYADEGSGAASLPFRLSSSGQTLTLMNVAGQAVDVIEVPPLEQDQVYCRDESGAWQTSFAGTPGEANRAGAAAGENVTAAVDSPVVISEVMTRNATYAADRDGEFWDYVELTNISGAEVSLGKWFLTDDRTNIARWQFPEVSLPAGGSLLVYCSGYDRADDAANLHANFRLSSDGTDVILTCSDGRTAAMLEVPALETDQAWSLVNGQWSAELAPTPGMANTIENAASAGESIRQTNASGVIINEIAAATSTTTPDWIEIYNGGAQAADLSGWGVSDNAARPRKWQFPQGTLLQPGQYAAVFCNGENKAEGGKFYTNFKLSMDGGYSVTLSTPEGVIVDRVYLPQQYEDISYGRANGGLRYFTLSTPLAANDGAGYLGRADAAEYSVSGGLFTTGQTLQVELSAQPGARIHYTLDNTDPTEASPLYTGPITVTGTTILRTRVYADGCLESFMNTQSYLYDVNNGNGAYVVSLVSDPDNLFSDEKGIMAKGPNAAEDFPYTGANFHNDWEREAHVEVFGGDGAQQLSSECGIKMHGQHSRAMAQQPFKVIARNKYGNDRFQISMFSARDYTEYQSFVLRAGGQDCERTRLRDTVLGMLAADTSLMYMEAEIGVLYLNGEYWGHYNLRERINPESICQFEGWEGDEDAIDLIKSNTIVLQGSNEHFEKLLAWVKQTDPTTEAFYETLGTAIDIRNYIEYMATEIFIGNTDTLNVKRYRNPNADGKWRWVLFDLDRAFSEDTNSINRWLTPGGMDAGKRTDNTLFIACMKNPRFRDEFLTYMGERMATAFSTESMLALIQKYYSQLEPLLADQLARWGITEKKYQSELKRFLTYAEERPMKLMGYFSTTKFLNLTGEEMVHYFGRARDAALAYSAD